MKKWMFFLVFLLGMMPVFSQQGYLFVRKGIKKVRTYHEGERIALRDHDGYLYAGNITLLRNDSIFINGLPLARAAVKQVLLPRRKKQFKISAPKFLLITGGVALVTAGLSLSHQADFQEALVAGTVIGYGPLLLDFIGSKISLRKKKYRIGGRFRLQMIDFYVPRKAF